jgi:hypothetical protein
MEKLFTRKKEKIFSRHPVSVLIVAALLATAYLPIAVLAHGGEDHGDAEHPVVASGVGTVTRTARAGEWEIVIKHPPLEPDRELAARVFVTRFETNEPIGNAQVKIVISGSNNNGGAPVEATASASQTAGFYDVRLPSLPEGEYQLAAQIGANGANQTVRFGALRVAPTSSSTIESGSGWARTILLMVALLVGLGLIGLIAIRALQSSRRKEEASA